MSYDYRECVCICCALCVAIPTTLSTVVPVMNTILLGSIKETP